MAFGKRALRTQGQTTRSLYLRRLGNAVFDALNCIFLLLFCLSILYPFWLTFLTSFSDGTEALSIGFHIWIKKWTVDSYRFALSKYGNIPVAYKNTIFRTVLGTALVVVFTLLGAYPLSKRDLPGRKTLTIYILITMFFSGGMIPSYLLIRSLGLFDTRLSLLLPMMVNGFNIVIARNFLMALDRSYEESALADGANYLQILVHIVAPLSKPVIAVIALWAAVSYWNEWFHALIYISSDSKIVLQVVLRRMIQQDYQAIQEMRQFGALLGRDLPPEAAVKAAIIMLTIGPIIIVYPIAQKYFVKGILVGSLKG